jgi:hypothetical protein
MENQITKEDSEFCNCQTETVFNIVPFEQKEETPETTYCELCRKPLPDPFRCTFSFNNNIKIIEPKTDFSREEFEEWQNNHVVSKHISYEEHLAESEKETL